MQGLRGRSGACPLRHRIDTINPATGALLKTCEGWSREQIDWAVDQAQAAARHWGRQPLEARVAAVKRLAAELRRQKDRFAQLVTAEMGKSLAEAASELEKSAVTATYYADNAARLLADEPVAIDGVDAWVSYEPIGLVLAVMPWNFPVWQVMRFAIPSITAGNGVLLKHSPNVTGSALALQERFRDAVRPVGEHLDCVHGTGREGREADHHRRSLHQRDHGIGRTHAFRRPPRRCERTCCATRSHCGFFTPSALSALR